MSKVCSITMLVSGLIFCLIATKFIACEPHKRVRNGPADIPIGSKARGLCRLLISELNTYPKWTDGQFLEMMIFCQPTVKVRETPFKMATFKVAFISHDGFLLGVCKLQGSSMYKKGKTGKFMAYTIGHKNIPNVNMDIENCEIPPDIYRDQRARHFPTGNEYPVAVALLYNEREATLDDITLRRFRENFIVPKITFQMQQTIMRNLQDMYVYASASPVSRCKYFSNFYSHYDIDTDHVLRDWIVQNTTDLGLSRCGSISQTNNENTWLPFQPDLFAMAPISPGDINVCERAVKFIIEDLTPRRKTPRLDDDAVGEYACYVITADEAVDSSGVITLRRTYMEKFTNRQIDASRCRDIILPDTDTAVLMEIDDSISSIDTNKTQDSSGQICPELSNNYTLICTQDNSSLCESNIITACSQFEISLEKEKPYLWNDCNEYSRRPDIVRVTTGIGAWLFVRDVIDKLVCFWLEVLEASKRVRCRLCHMLLEQNILVDRPGSDYITKLMSQGQGSNDTRDKVKSRNGVNIRRHLENPLHQISVEYFRLYDSGLRGENLREAFEAKGSIFRTFLIATENVIATVFQATRLGISFFSYRILVETLNFHGVDVGHLYGNPTRMKTALMSISEVMHSNYLESLRQNQPTLTIMIDTSSDIASLPSMAVIFTTYDSKNAVTTKLYRILELTAGESADSLFEVFLNSIKEDHIDDFVRSRCVGFTSDGGSNVLKFRRLLDQYTDHELITNHCVGHRLELVTQHAWDDYNYLSIIDKTINQLYRMFNSRSPKKKQLMKLAILELKDTDFEFKKIRRIRWVSHKLRASETILNHWETIIRTLELAIKDKTINLQSRQDARDLLKLLKDGTFLATLSFVVDISRKLSDLSRAAQIRGFSLITKRERRDNLTTELTNYKHHDGMKLYELLNASSFADSSPGYVNLQRFEMQRIAHKGVELSLPDEIYNDVRLYHQREEYVNSLLTQIEVYFPDDPTDTFQIFDAKHWNNNNLQTYGARRLLEANRRLKWNFNENVLSREWILLKNSLFSQEDFEIHRLENPENFWAYYLNQSSVTWGSSIKSVLSGIITVPMCSAEVERVYSLYTATKTNRRWSLKVNTIDAIVRIKFNGPKSLSELDTLTLAKGFLKQHSRADDKSRKQTLSNDKAETAVIEEFNTDSNTDDD